MNSLNRLTRIALLGGVVLLVSACSHPIRFFPNSGGPSVTQERSSGQSVAPALVASELLVTQFSADVDALMAKARGDGRAPQDLVLFELGLALLAAPDADRSAAREVFVLLLADFPDSERRRGAKAILGLLKQADALGQHNASLQQKLNQILDIDLEAERQRQAVSP